MKHIKSYKIFESEFVSKEDIDILLDKINDSGIESLTDIDKNRLTIFNSKDKEIISIIDKMGDVTLQFKQLNKRIDKLNKEGQSDESYNLFKNNWNKLNDEMVKLEREIESYGIQLGDHRLSKLMSKERPDAYMVLENLKKSESVIKDYISRQGELQDYQNKYIEDMKSVLPTGYFGKFVDFYLNGSSGREDMIGRVIKFLKYFKLDHQIDRYTDLWQVYDELNKKYIRKKTKDLLNEYGIKGLDIDIISKKIYDEITFVPVDDVFNSISITKYDFKDEDDFIKHIFNKTNIRIHKDWDVILDNDRYLIYEILSYDGVLALCDKTHCIRSKNMYQSMSRGYRMFNFVDKSNIKDSIFFDVSKNGNYVRIHSWNDRLLKAINSGDDFDDAFNTSLLKEVSEDKIKILKELLPKFLKKETVISESLKYHIDNNMSVTESIYRSGSTAHINLLKESRELFDINKILLSNDDKILFESTDIGRFGEYMGIRVPLDMPFDSEINPINEALYKGREVELNHPKRGGSKKYYVYTKNPDTGKVIKVCFGDTTGLTAKISDPEARKSFSARHKCNTKNDRTKPGYWSCRLTRYGKILGFGKNYPGYW